MSEKTLQSGEGLSGGAEATPFQVVVRNVAAPPVVEAVPETAEWEDASISLEEIEAAYLRALESADLAESQSAMELESSGRTPSSETPSEPEEERNHETRVLEQGHPEPPRSGEVAETSVPIAAAASRDLLEESGGGEAGLPVTSAEQVVEALLFVGGAPLPVRKFLEVLGGTYSAEQVELILTRLNNRYESQRRPYEIRLIEGGYQVQLVPAYEGIRARAYGQGPKEVKLAQDALEVLALIAYQQPVGRAALNDIGKANLPGLLRQLLRRELICVDRTDPEQGECYRSTPRFLELFGLSSLDDLPQAGTFQFR